uniref:C2HC zinc finger plants domain-containing protein n=1 Tax=Pyrodinium bahamense TaxID=73915 RepID=A0A7S0A3Q4_9DINO|mmetsp:Transcript_20694/g.57196  ORF Transcript_20694/g.57196 Transcript_20694/m.57196 type:complete len:144 (+) Transcript_20694:61-492(+)|eukprot:CAMPEP_0179025346 /NCGR_PEP_ID=MMETSP0796-20121207/7932_1 /TAXON_ID=73915 /ORGANISM="Pyrodinium bahamense, Strain pbaha01" /LENGTH=143 /DNA_ID=CAMNT_0020721353 /DNA_START=57 /DNA_END=488 /DNA_ORIENTATION=+
MTPLAAPSLVVEELLGGSFLRLDAGDPDGALACALQAMQLSAGPSAAIAARQAAEHSCAVQICEEILRRGGILADRGHAAVLRKALEDGTSVVCTRCAALVAKQRMEAHRTHWCTMLGDDTCEVDAAPQDLEGAAPVEWMEVD